MGDLPERLNDLDQSIHNLKGWMASLSNDLNSGQSKTIEWQQSHEKTHEKMFEEIAEIKEPIRDISNALSGLGVVSKGLIIVAKTVAAITVIYGAMWAFVHFGDPRPKP